MHQIHLPHFYAFVVKEGSLDISTERKPQYTLSTSLILMKGKLRSLGLTMRYVCVYDYMH